MSTIEVKITYPNKNVYEGVAHYDTKKKRYVITGDGKLEVHDKGTFKGWFENGKINGKGKFMSKWKGTYEGYFKDGKMEGKGEYRYSNGGRLEIEWLDNKPHGSGYYHHPSKK